MISDGMVWVDAGLLMGLVCGAIGEVIALTIDEMLKEDYWWTTHPQAAHIHRVIHGEHS